VRDTRAPWDSSGRLVVAVKKKMNASISGSAQTGRMITRRPLGTGPSENPGLPTTSPPRAQLAAERLPSAAVVDEPVAAGPATRRRTLGTGTAKGVTSTGAHGVPSATARP
jgi:hypothetical protein